jgi:hypothetical protein
MRIQLHEEFKRNAKKLNKKYPSLVADLRTLQTALLANPTLGDSLGDNRYKVRLKITSKGQGKSGGGRVITYLKQVDDELWLLTIYDKSEMENVNDDYLDDLVKKLKS